MSWFGSRRHPRSFLSFLCQQTNSTEWKAKEQEVRNIESPGSRAEKRIEEAAASRFRRACGGLKSAWVQGREKRREREKVVFLFGQYDDRRQTPQLRAPMSRLKCLQILLPLHECTRKAQ